jgi:hypothetical protein
MPLVSAVGWFGSFYAIYGTTDPSAPYGTYTQSELAHVPAGLTGLLFDHQFGVIPNAPIFLVALCALGWLIVRRPRATMTSAPAAVSVAGVSVAGVSVVGVSAVITMSAAGGHIADTGVMSDVSPRRLAIELACVVTPYILAAAMYRMWWGGWSAPARFLVAVLPTLALPAAMCWAFARSKTTRASAMVALAASVWLSLSLLFVQNGRLAYNDRDGFALWTDWANPVVDLANGMPSLFRETWPAALTVAMIWTGLLAATWLALRLVEWRLGLASLAASDLAVSDRAAPDLAASDLNGQSRASRRQGLARAFPLAVVPTAYAVAAMLAFSLAWNYEHASGLRPDFAQIALLRRIYTGLRPWGVVYGQTTRIARPPQGADEVAAGKTARVRAGGLLLPSVVPASAIPARLSINSVARRLPRDQPLLYLPRVPSGRYRLFVTVLGIPDGRLDLLVGRSATPIRSYDLAAVTASPGVPQITRASFSNSNFTAASATSSMFTRETKHEFELTLPVNVSMMSVMPDARARKVVGKITLEPLAIPGIEADALPGQYAYQATRYGTTILYAATPDVYLEPSGLWVRPELETDLLIEPAQAVVSWTVFVRNGPVDNQVRLEVEGWHRELALPAGAEMEVTVPASRRGPTPLRIVSAKGFRPSAIDPKNGDHRRLGVWVEIR